MLFLCKSYVLYLLNEKDLIKNNMGVFFIGFFISLPGEFIFENDRHLFTIIGFLLMLASFYLMYLNSKQKNK